VIVWGFFCLRSHVVEIFDDNKLTELGFFSRFLSVIVHPVSDTEMAICITEQEMYVSGFHKKMHVHKKKLTKYLTQGMNKKN